MTPQYVYTGIHSLGSERTTCKLAILAVIFLIGAVLGACDLLGGEAETAEVGTLLFAVEESWPEPDSASAPVISVRIETERQFPCINYGLETDERLDGNRLTIRVEEVVRPSTCLTAIGPAQTGIVVDLVAGHYRFELDRTGAERPDRYDLTVSDSLIALSPTDTSFTRPFFEQFWRTPERSFGLYCWTPAGERSYCDAFVDTLESTLTLDPVFFPDSGGRIYPRRTRGHGFDLPPRYYVYPKTSSFEEARALLEAYTRDRLRGVRGVGISLISWRGARAQSWSIDEDAEATRRYRPRTLPRGATVSR